MTRNTRGLPTLVWTALCLRRGKNDVDIATRDGSLAWLEEAAKRDEDYGSEAFLNSVDGLAMGRGTCDHIAHLDPLPFGSRPVFVFTHRPPAPRDGVTFWKESPRAALGRWTAMGRLVNLTYSIARQRGELTGGSSPSGER